MIADSNFYVLRTMRLSSRERDRRISHLQNTLAQLNQYHRVARPLKRPVIFRLIVKYENLISQIKGE